MPDHWRCDDCEQDFQSHDAFERHLRDIHGDERGELDYGQGQSSHGLGPSAYGQGRA